MNQAIKIIDEMIEEVRNPWKEWETMHKTQVLKELRDKISSLPSDTQWIDEEDDGLLFGGGDRKGKEIHLPSLEFKIDTLQRYKSTPDDFCTMQASGEGEYIKYSELKKLLED